MRGVYRLKWFLDLDIKFSFCFVFFVFFFRIRIICYRIATNKYFVNFVLVLIIVSSILLAVEDPLNASAERNQVSKYVNNYCWC